MSTRRANADAPLSQERYMSDPEFAERRILGGAVTAKASTLTAREKSLLFFIQSLSIGLKWAIDPDLQSVPHLTERLRKKLPNLRLGPWLELELRLQREDPEALERFLIELCINPKFKFKAGEDDLLPIPQEIVHNLFAIEAEARAAMPAGIAETEVFRKVCATLDAAVKHPSRGYRIDGAEGIGKSVAAQTWCQQNRGIARYVSLSGAVNKTAIFRAIARALGLGASFTRKASDMQARVEDMLQRSNLMLVIDEAGYLLPQSQRVYSRPEMLDWCYTALTNFGVPCVLLCTPVFDKRLTMAERQTVWNSRQFRRRYEYVPLPPTLSLDDLKLVAAKLMPECGEREAAHVADYAICTEWPLTSVGKLIEDARDLSGGKLSFRSIERAIQERQPSDAAQAEALAKPTKQRTISRPNIVRAGFGPRDGGAFAESPRTAGKAIELLS